MTFKGRGRDVTGRAWEHAGKCWKMMINYGCGQGFEGECVFLDEVIWADVPTFLKIRDFVRDD